MQRYHVDDRNALLDPDGGWVKWDDHVKALRHETARAEDQIRRKQETQKATGVARAELKAEREKVELLLRVISMLLEGDV